MEPTLTQAANSIGLAKAVLKDIGWTTSNSDKPIISDIENLEILNANTSIISFALMDNDTDITSVNTTANSSNTAVIENSGISINGNQRLRQLSITPVVGISGNASITLSASDGINSRSQTFQVNVVSNLTPSISINSPTDGVTFLSDTQNFTATASDTEDGDVSQNIVWTSSINGATPNTIGNGANIETSLDDGNHVITASITDSTNNTETAAINITVNAQSDDDNDGLTNSIEIFLGTDPFDSDSDDDFLSDYDEVNMDGNPNDFTPGSDTDPNNEDTDGDNYVDGLDSNPLTPDPAEGNIPLLPQWAMFALMTLIVLVTRKRLKHSIRI
jgi:hypothetical protein